MLSKIYLLFAFSILMYFAISLGQQIIQTQKLNKDLQSYKLKARDKKNFDNSLILANLYFQKGLYTSAIEEYTYCLEVWNENDRLGISYVLNRLVLTYSLLKEDQIALYYCKNALNVTSSSVGSLLNLNRLYESFKQNKIS